MFITAEMLSDLLTIVLLDLVLAGDNAIVIALAARDLPRTVQMRAIFWGSFGAVAVRVLLTAIVVYLLRLPGLMLIGGVLLLPIAWKLLCPSTGSEPGNSAVKSFWAAFRTIVVADALMGLDNVLAIAGAADGQMILVVIGLLMSVPLVVWGSTLILHLTERFPFIVYIGAAVIAGTAGRMITDDHLWSGWFEVHSSLKFSLSAMLVAAICAGGWSFNRFRRTAS